MRQQGWKIERVTKENRALELQNVELRKRSADVRAENLEVSALSFVCVCVCRALCLCSNNLSALTLGNSQHNTQVSEKIVLETLPVN